MTRPVHVLCTGCGAVNRVPEERQQEGGICGRCHRPLFDGKPHAADLETLERHVGRGGLPVLVDFWAPWCSPCRGFAPVFEEAAGLLEPRVRLLKADTQSDPRTAARYGVRSIPTLILFRGGREAARHVGTLDLGGLLRWVEAGLR